MQVQPSFSLLFWINRTKIKNNKAPIYVRITVNGKRAEISVKRSVEPENWNTEKGLVKGTKEEARSINNYIEQIRLQLHNIYQKLSIEKQLITAELIKNTYLGVGQNEHTLMNLIEYHNTQLKDSLEPGTMKNYYTTQKYVEMFLKSQLKTNDIFLSQLSYKFIVDFEYFIKHYQPLDHHKPCGQNTTMKHIERFRKMINLSIKFEWLEKDPFIKFKPVFNKSDKEFLTIHELKKIENKNFTIKRLQYVKDLFVFSCYTSLAYIDVMNLTLDNLILGFDNQWWVITSRQKTDIGMRIPLLPPALEIIEKYKLDVKANSHGTLFPPISNQKLNSYLKEVADLNGIEKNLTFHLARHTFATTVALTNGVPMETVSKIMGHNSLRTTQIYAKVVDVKVANDMNSLRQKLFPQETSDVVNIQQRA